MEVLALNLSGILASIVLLPVLKCFLGSERMREEKPQQIQQISASDNANAAECSRSSGYFNVSGVLTHSQRTLSSEKFRLKEHTGSQLL